MNRQKYDRQLRLWGDQGQEALESCHILCLGSTAVMSEILKNLVLPGIGTFTLVDDVMTTEKDLGTNFFLETCSVGQPRAEQVTKFLLELNPQVNGSFALVNPIDYIHQTNLSSYSIIISCLLPTAELEFLSKSCWQHHIPLLHTCTLGFFGYFTLQLRDHTIMDTHPDQLVDYRLDEPFDELKAFCDGLKLSEMSEHQLSHVPWPVLVLKACDQFKEMKGIDKITSKDRDLPLLKRLISNLIQNPLDDENINEALANAYRVFSPTVIPDRIQQLFDCQGKQGAFWDLVSELQGFVETFHRLPVSGVLPDMKSDTDTFVALQKVYRNKAKMDQSYFKSHPDLVDVFCKHAFHLQSITSYQLLQVPVGEDDFSRIYQCCRIVEESMTRGETLVFEKQDKWALEFTREQGAVLHNIASLMGGMVSQEVIKVVTHQYLPIKGTMVLNGIDSTTGVL